MSRTNRNALSISVREVMTRKVSSVQPKDDVRRVLAMMRTARVRRVPVLDAAGEIVETLRDVYVRGSRAA
jgi:predicted transcriptional regulator